MSFSPKRRKLSKYFNVGPRIYSNYIYNAKKRGLEMMLSEGDMIRLYHMPCFYCNLKPSYPNLGGVDRIDSDKKYTFDNIVPCCKMCNFMKGNSDVNIFLNQIKIISGRIIEIEKNLSDRDALTVIMSGSEISTNIFQHFKRDASSGNSNISAPPESKGVLVP